MTAADPVAERQRGAPERGVPKGGGGGVSNTLHSHMLSGYNHSLHHSHLAPTLVERHSGFRNGARLLLEAMEECKRVCLLSATCIIHVKCAHWEECLCPDTFAVCVCPPAIPGLAQATSEMIQGES